MRLSISRIIFVMLVIFSALTLHKTTTYLANPHDDIAVNPYKRGSLRRYGSSSDSNDYPNDTDDAQMYNGGAVVVEDFTRVPESQASVEDDDSSSEKEDDDSVGQEGGDSSGGKEDDDSAGQEDDDSASGKGDDYSADQDGANSASEEDDDSIDQEGADSASRKNDHDSARQEDDDSDSGKEDGNSVAQEGGDSTGGKEDDDDDSGKDDDDSVSQEDDDSASEKEGADSASRKNDHDSARQEDDDSDSGKEDGNSVAQEGGDSTGGKEDDDDDSGKDDDDSVSQEDDDSASGKEDDDDDSGKDDDDSVSQEDDDSASGKEGDDSAGQEDDNSAHQDSDNSASGIGGDDSANKKGKKNGKKKDFTLDTNLNINENSYYDVVVERQTKTEMINGIEFINDIDETGHPVHRLKDPLPVSVLKLPTPIFLLSLPKSGTTTVHQYFQCGLGIGASAHHKYPYKKYKKLKLVGTTMRNNIKNHRPLLTWTPDPDESNERPDILDQYLIFSDFDDYRTKTIYSMLDTLENIREFYPKATILYLNRDAASWFGSARKFGTLINRWQNKKLTPLVESLFTTDRKQFPPKKDPAAVDFWVQFYQKYTDAVRDFATDNPSLTFLEVPLDDDTPAVMEEKVGLPKECFGHANAAAKGVKEHGIKIRGGPKPFPREWTVETYS